MTRNVRPFLTLVVVAAGASGCTLLHTKRAADQALLLAAAQYQNTVLRAYQNVADTLHAIAAAMAHNQAVLNTVQAQATRFGDTAALYQALGGGWWNRDTALATAGVNVGSSAVAAAN
jgi:outer membrane protein TolC